MTTNPKSNCCGADAQAFQISPVLWECTKCNKACDLQDQSASNLDEVVRKTTIEVIELNFEIVGDPHDRIAQAIKLAFQEYSADLQQSLTKANEELVELRKDKDRLDWLERNLHSVIISGRYLNDHGVSQHFKKGHQIREAIDSAIAAQEKMK